MPALTAALAAARAQQIADRNKVLDYVNNQSQLLKPPVQLVAPRLSRCSISTTRAPSMISSTRSRI